MAWDFETDAEYPAVMGIADGPTEAREKYAEYLEHEVGNQ